MLERGDLGVAMQRFLAEYDLLVTPSTALPAFAAGVEYPDPERPERWSDWAGFSYPFNLTQQPAISVPVGFTADGLPIGLQIVAAKYADALVLRAGRAFEAALPAAACRTHPAGPSFDLALAACLARASSAVSAHGSCNGRKSMRSFIRASMLGAVSALALSVAAEAKTLVYCSEGSPEGFNPQLFTAGTTFDASSKPVYNRLIEFERGDTKTVPGAGRELHRLGRRPGLHLQAASRREVAHDQDLHADARLQRRRRGVHVHAAAGPESSLSTRSRAAPTSTSRAWTWAICSSPSRRSTT